MSMILTFDQGITSWIEGQFWFLVFTRMSHNGLHMATTLILQLMLHGHGEHSFTDMDGTLVSKFMGRYAII